MEDCNITETLLYVGRLPCRLKSVSVVCLQVSLASHITPSPDWFVGVDSVMFCDNGKWIPEMSLDLGILNNYNICVYFY